MIPALDDYEIFVRSILKKVPVLKTRQLVLALKNNYEDMDDNFAMSILFAMQRRGYVLLSETGWAMTQGAYLSFTDDFFFDGIVKNNTFRIPANMYRYGIDSEGKMNRLKEINLESELSKKEKILISCMWLVIDMLPDSEDFMIAEAPWSIVFASQPTEKKRGLLFEIAYVPEINEDIVIETIKLQPKIEINELRENIRRIAIMEDERHDWKIPYLGFYHICKINEQKAKGYEVISSRKKYTEAWKDYVV